MSKDNEKKVMGCLVKLEDQVDDLRNKKNATRSRISQFGFEFAMPSKNSCIRVPRFKSALLPEMAAFQMRSGMTYGS